MKSYPLPNWLPTPGKAELQALVGKPDPVILEVGSSDCEDTIRFLDAFPACRVICFEPDERPLARFRRHIPETETRVTMVPLVVGDVDGKVPWYACHGDIPAESVPHHPWAPEVIHDWDMSGSTCRPTGHLTQSPWVTFDEETQKDGIRLDTYALQAGLSSVDFIWADVQGAEHKLIAGAKELLKRTRFLFTEFYDPQLCGNAHQMPEHYAGQANLGTIISMLPGWTIRSFHIGHNVLLENRSE